MSTVYGASPYCLYRDGASLAGPGGGAITADAQARSGSKACIGGQVRLLRAPPTGVVPGVVASRNDATVEASSGDEKPW